MKVLIHKNTKPGDVLRFADGRLKVVLQSGAKVNVTRDPDGTLRHETKASKRAHRTELKTGRWLSKRVPGA